MASDRVFHHHEGDGPHPLDGIAVMIAQSAGDGLLAKLKRQGVDTAMTAETDPAKAVADYLGDRLAAPRPRPIGALICKTIDLFSKHK